MDYSEMSRLEKEGRLLIGIDRVTARKFYTDIPIEQIQEMTGESPHIEKAIVWIAFVVAPLTLVATIALGFMAFGFWGVCSFLLCPVIYYIYTSHSASGKSRLLGISLLLIVSAGTHFSGSISMPKVTGFATMFLLSLWSIRFMYITSTSLLRAFVIRNPRAYEWLLPSIVIADSGETNP